MVEFPLLLAAPQAKPIFIIAKVISSGNYFIQARFAKDTNESNDRLQTLQGRVSYSNNVMKCTVGMMGIVKMISGYEFPSMEAAVSTSLFASTQAERALRLYKSVLPTASCCGVSFTLFCYKKVR